jgi:hypothetical protein
MTLTNSLFDFVPTMALGHWLGLLSLLIGFNGLLVQQFFARRRLSRSSMRARRRQPLRTLARWADCFGLPTRKAIKALVGDYAVEIRRLRRERRKWMARWNVCLAWGFATWYVIRGPFDAVVQYLVKSIGRPG